MYGEDGTQIGKGQRKRGSTLLGPELIERTPA
jgi:hypothetical protein